MQQDDFYARYLQKNISCESCNVIQTLQQWLKGSFQVEMLEGYLNLESEDIGNDLFNMSSTNVSSRDKGHIDHLILQVKKKFF